MRRSPKFVIICQPIRLCASTLPGDGMTLDESEQVETLLLEWHRWQDVWRPALSGGRCDSTCREFKISKQLMTPAELAAEADAKIWKANSEIIDMLVDALTWQHRAAIQTSLRNKRSGASVFSNARLSTEESHALYQEAKEILFPKFEFRGLIKPPMMLKNNFAEVLVNSAESCQY